MATAVLIGDAIASKDKEVVEYLVKNKIAKLWSRIVHLGQVKSLPSEKVRAVLAEKDVVFLKRGTEWATDETIADEVRTKLEMRSFRIMNAATFPMEKLEQGDVVVFVGEFGGVGWYMVEIE